MLGITLQLTAQLVLLFAPVMMEILHTQFLEIDMSEQHLAQIAIAMIQMETDQLLDTHGNNQATVVPGQLLELIQPIL
jgi:hypothetical protein